MAPGYLADFHRLALELGLDPVALMQCAGIGPEYLGNPGLPVPVPAMVDLLEITALTSGIDDLGLRLGEMRGIADVGPFILPPAARTGTLRDVLRKIASPLVESDAIYMHLIEGQNPILAFDLMVGGVRQCRQAIETTLAITILILRWVLGDRWVPMSVSFKHSAPASRVRHERLFSCPIDFLHEFNAIVLHRADLDKRLPASVPVVRQQVEHDNGTANPASIDLYVHQVTQAIALALPRGEARLVIIARSLGADPRTINRRLARAGMTYLDVVNNVRKSMAVQYMLSSDRPLSDVAGLVGFNSLSSFTRWFGQSFGCAPSAWRRAHQEP